MAKKSNLHHAAIVAAALWAGAPLGVAAQQNQQPTISLTPAPVDRTTAEFGCRIPMEIAHQGVGDLKDMAVAVEARDRDGRKLESSGFRTDPLPAIGGALRNMDLQFSQAACGEIATIVVTTATCTFGDGRVVSCLDSLKIKDPSDALAYEVDRN